MSIHENTHPQTQKQKQKHKDKHKSTIAIKQRKKNAQATTESEQENITDQEELLLLAETELVQGGEEQLWELFFPLSPLLPANIRQLSCTTHLRKTTNTVGLRHPKLKKLCLPIYQFYRCLCGWCEKVVPIFSLTFCHFHILTAFENLPDVAQDFATEVLRSISSKLEAVFAPQQPFLHWKG